MYVDSVLKTLARSSTDRPRMKPKRGLRLFFSVLLLLFVLTGCSTTRTTQAPRIFDFYSDTFSYPNELVWTYEYDAQGGWTTRPREPKPDYALHCFVLARSARQFLDAARFAPEQPLADQETYRGLIRRVVSSNPRKPLPENEKIVIPGYANLRQFSEVEEALLKQEAGGAWQSYFQRGHWRMIFPFSRSHQQETAEKLLARVRVGETAILHILRFPQLTINHAVLLYGAEENEAGVTFTIYDPNRPDSPGVLKYDRASRTFELPANFYFRGGRVDVYEVFRGTFY
jgi:hypothetical protein